MARTIRRPGDVFFDPKGLTNAQLRANAELARLVSTSSSAAAREAAKRAASRQVVSENQKEFIEYLDRDMVDPTAGQAPLNRVQLIRDKSGKVVDSKVVKTSNANAFLTPQDRENLRMQRQLEGLRKRTIGRLYLQTEAERKLAIRAMRNYVYKVSRVLLIKSNIATSRELLKILGKIHALLDAQTVAIVEKGLKETLHEISKLELYYFAMTAIQQRKVNIFINDIGLLEKNEEMQRVLQGVSFGMAKGIQKLIYECMRESFNEAWNGLGPDQFPFEYRNLVRRVINRAERDKRVILTGNLVTNWQIIADFEEIFGNRVDFMKGFHYGAMLQEGSKGKTDLKFTGARHNRARLPYTKQLLKNPTNVRYAYWKAMWRDEPVPPPGIKPKDRFFSPTFAETRKEHYAASARRLERLAKRRAGFEITLENAKKAQESAIRSQHRLRGNTNIRRAELQVSVDEASALISKTMDQISYVQKGEAYSQKHKFSQPKKIKDAQKMKSNTIAARVQYWGRINKAPVWILLEFGQLSYEPKIPPRGVYYRFMAKLQRRVRELVRQAQNEQGSRYYGYTVNPAGRRIVSTPQAGETQIQFWLANPAVSKRFKPGEMLPESTDVYKKFVIAHAIGRRSIDAAAKIGSDVSAARAIVEAAKEDFEKAIGVSRTALSAITSRTPPTHKPYTRNYYAETARGSESGTSLRGANPIFTSRQTLKEKFDEPHLGSGFSSRKTNKGPDGLPTYTPLWGAGFFQDNPEGRRQSKIAQGLPNKGLRIAYIGRIMRKRRGY